MPLLWIVTFYCNCSRKR